MEYQLPATTVETGAMPCAPYVVSQPMAMDGPGAYMTGAPYTTYGGYSMSPYMPAMPGVGGLDHCRASGLLLVRHCHLAMLCDDCTP